MTLAVLVLLWGAYALVDGVLALLGAFLTTHDHRWRLLLEGLVGVAAGVLTFVWPGLTALALVCIIAASELVTGRAGAGLGSPKRRVIDNEWRLALGGVASIVFGLVLLIALAARLRGMGQRHPVHATAWSAGGGSAIPRS